MLEITINVQAPELSNAILALASALGGQIPATTNYPTLTAINGGASIPQVPYGTGAPISQPNNTGTPVVPPTYDTHVTSGPAIGSTIPPVTGATAPNLAPQMPEVGVPTTTPTYTMEQLAVAATQLMDAPGHNMSELTALLAQYGVQALTQLPKEQYGSFATQLRAKGAKI